MHIRFLLTCLIASSFLAGCRGAPAGSPAALTPAASSAGPTELPMATGPLPESEGVEVSFVKLSQEGEYRWRAEVTLRFPGADAEDQISGWSVILPDNSVAVPGPSGQTADIAPRDPPLRSVTDARSGIDLPTGTRLIIVRGYTSGGAPAARELTIDLNLDRGPGFSIEHTY
ncbi:MAG: hypothetical protein ACH37Z_12450 [Anaerolineae bacterium]